jgi:hypothetical protein
MWNWLFNWSALISNVLCWCTLVNFTCYVFSSIIWRKGRAFVMTQAWYWHQTLVKFLCESWNFMS